MGAETEVTDNKKSPAHYDDLPHLRFGFHVTATKGLGLVTCGRGLKTTKRGFMQDVIAKNFHKAGTEVS